MQGSSLARLCMLQQMAGLLNLQYLFGLLVFWTDAQSVIFEKNSTIPVKSSSLELSCRQSVPFTDSSISFNNKDKDIACAAYNYMCDYYKVGYTFTANTTGAFAVITSLNRTSDELTWTCEYNTSQSTRSLLDIIVYTIPTGIAFTQDPNASGDLSLTPVTLQCKTTSCMYPMASVQWLYQDQSNPNTEVLFTTTNPSGTPEFCEDQEQIYTSKLDLPLYTTSNDNTDETVTFSCRIVYLDPSIHINATGPHTVRFAVRVTEAVLQQNNQNITDTLIVTSGESVTLTCVTATGRPTPTIDWYLGSEKKGIGVNLTFSPSDADHNKTIYCQAFNTDISRNVSSLKPSLFVQVRVTEAVLQQNNQNITDSLTVTSGESVNLTCTTTTSRPLPTIDWYLGSQKIGSGASMTFTPSNAHHNKTINCQAYNVNPYQPVYSLKPRLFVQVKVSEARITDPESGMLLFYEGFIKMLQCISSPSRPIASIRWYLGNRQLTDNITNMNHTDINGLQVQTSFVSVILTRVDINQTIYCDGYISGQTTPAVSSQRKIDVLYQPDTPHVMEYGTAFPWLENQTGILQCNSSDFGNPSSSVRWNSDIYAPDENGHLMIQKLVSSDNEKVVSCQLVNNYTIDKNVTVVSKPVPLRVQYWPVITLNISSPLTVNETQTISGLCSASGNPYPDPPIWRGKSAGSILRFDNISRNDKGTYTCVATATSSLHGKLESQRQLDIIVQYAPDVNVTVTSPAHQNATLIVLCQARGLPVEYMFHPWKQMWGDIVVRSDLQGNPSSSNNTLKLERLSLEDMGTYICSVDNKITGIDGNLTQIGAVDLKVTGKPIVLKEEENHFAEKAGHSINISIPFYSDPPIETFIFQKNGTGLKNSSRTTMSISTSITVSIFYGTPVGLKVKMASLFIQNLTQDDFDNYTLLLENVLGTKEFRLQLDELGTTSTHSPVIKPQKPGPNVAGIAGGIGAAVVVIAIVAVVIILIKRRNKSNGTPLEPNERSEDINNSESELVDNPMYATSGPRFGLSTGKGTTVDEYAAVDKPKKKDALVEDNSTLYAQVDKTNKNGKKGDIYQNIDPGGKKTNADSEYENSRRTRTETSDGNVYENPGTIASNNTLVNKDGLLYADLMLNPPTTKNGKVVIRGIENRTEYAEIAYGKRGEPLPDSDEEKVDGCENKRK